MVTKREKEERKDNIVIRSLNEGKNAITKKEIEEFINEKLGVETKALWCRKSGRVVVARLESEEKKKEVMKNKSKLKGGIVTHKK